MAYHGSQTAKSDPADPSDRRGAPAQAEVVSLGQTDTADQTALLEELLVATIQSWFPSGVGAPQLANLMARVTKRIIGQPRRTGVTTAIEDPVSAASGQESGSPVDEARPLQPALSPVLPKTRWDPAAQRARRQPSRERVRFLRDLPTSIAGALRMREILKFLDSRGGSATTSDILWHLEACGFQSSDAAVATQLSRMKSQGLLDKGAPFVYRLARGAWHERTRLEESYATQIAVFDQLD